MQRLMAFVFMLSTFFVFSQSDWELKKDKNGIQVYVRDVVYSKIKEFKATALVETKLEKVVDFIMDGDNLKNWNYKTSDSKTIKELSAHERIIWIKNDLPWPIRNRDHVTHMKVLYPSEGQVKILLLPDTSKTVAVRDDAVRVVDFNGHWLIERKGDGVQVTHQLFGDPNGHLPSWLLNSLLTNAPYSSFSKMKKMLERKDLSKAP